jgi:dihydroxy-acid dehydratase
MNKPLTGVTRRKLRSSEWFNNPHNPGMTALYLERYLNYGLTRHELQSGKPIIGIAQTGNDLSPCNRHHLELAHRVREGIRAAGGIAMEFPMHPIQETGKRPTAALDRNLAYLGLVEILFGYPLDGVVLTTGCDKTTPACLMAAATVNMPAIVLSGGPMLNGWHKGLRTGSGTVVWKAREELAAGDIDYEEFMDIVASSAPSVGHCNTMGTASTMNSLAEALGMSLPGCAAIPAPYRERGQIAFETGTRIVGMVWEDLKPSDQRADSHQCAGPPYRRRALDRGLAEVRPRRSAAGQHAAGRLLSRRGISPRRRRAVGGARIDGAQAHP